MNVHSWDRAKEVFLLAADLPPDRITQFLDEECAGEPEIRAEVESLLTADRKNGAGIAAAVQTEAALLLESPGPGDRLGPYRIEREIGRGGMGTVFLATRDDQQFRKRVAIKVVKRGMDTAEVLERFRYERQILADLDHPYIAALYDGGTTPDGLPYFVMEYVEGQPLDDFCREQNLDVKDRCRLFMKICQAVAHAHRNLVVHRDLKPGNILITADGTPKLLDFGIAKLLSDHRGLSATVTNLRPFTPEYASPEQVRGFPVATTTDVYLLGAVLYELLTGKRAHNITGSSSYEIERLICEVDPPRPSESAPKLRKQLAGDLDAIVAKAMRKEPQLRYASVEQFAADVEAYLAGHEVAAHRGDASYRARKYVQRNWQAIAVSALFAALLISGTAISMREAIQANQARTLAERERQRAEANQARAEASRLQAETSRHKTETSRREAETSKQEAELQRIAAETQRRIAERRFAQVRNLAGKFLFDFHDAIAKLPGSTKARKTVVETGLQYYDGLVRDAQGNRELLKEVARGYDRMGDAQGNPYYANLGDVGGALATYQKALAVRARISDPSPEFLCERIYGDIRVAQVLTAQGKMSDAEQSLKQAITLASRQSVAGDEQVLRAVASAYNSYGALKISLSQHSEAEKLFLKQLEISLQLAQQPRDPVPAQTAVSLAHTKLGDVYSRMDRNREALDHLRLAVEIDKRLAEGEPNNLPRLRKLYITYFMLGRVFRSKSGAQLAQPGETEHVLDLTASIAEKMMAADADNSQAVIDVMGARTAQGDWERTQHNLSSAATAYRKAMDAVQRLDSPHAVHINLDALGQSHQRLARVLIGSNVLEAGEHLQKAEDYFARAEQLNPGTNRGITRKAEILSTKAELNAAQKKWTDAIQNFTATISIFETQHALDPRDDALLNEQPVLYAQLADCYAAAGQSDAAVHAMQTAMDRTHEIEAHRPLVSEEETERQTNFAKLLQWTRH